MFKNIIVFGHIFLFVINIVLLFNNAIISNEYVLLYCLFVVFTLFYFYRKANFIILAYIFGFTTVLGTGYLLQALSERVQFNGWMQEYLFDPGLMSQTNLVIMIAISCFCLGAIWVDKGNKMLLMKESKPLNFFERKSKNWVALISIVIGVTYSWLNGAPTLGEVAYGQAGGGQQEYGKEFSSFSYIIGIVFTGVAAY